MAVVFHTGKGNHLISSFVPKDCIKGMDLLCDKKFRRNVRIPDENQYVFANTEGSLEHTIGWNATNNLMVTCGIKTKSVNATGNRCRISTCMLVLICQN